MYTEEYEERGFSLKKILIRFVIIIAVVILLIWLMVNFIMPKLDSNNKEKKETINFNKVFDTNVLKVKEAALDYYTEELLKETEEFTMTLKEMTEKNIIDNISAEDSNILDYDKSNINLIKEENEYTLKINLVSKQDENKSKIFYLNHYDYCASYLCEEDLTKEEEKNKENNQEEINEEQVKIKQSKEDENNIEVNTDNSSESKVKTLYQYIKITSEKMSEWSEWADWIKSSCTLEEKICSTNDNNCLTEVQVSKKNSTECYKRIRTRTKLSSSYKTTRWSIYDDKELLNNGWSYTGETITK